MTGQIIRSGFFNSIQLLFSYSLWLVNLVVTRHTNPFVFGDYGHVRANKLDICTAAHNYYALHFE